VLYGRSGASYLVSHLHLVREEISDAEDRNYRHNPGLFRLLRPSLYRISAPAIAPLTPAPLSAINTISRVSNIPVM
jgi:hypothetical protein